MVMKNFGKVIKNGAKTAVMFYLEGMIRTSAWYVTKSGEVLPRPSMTGL